MTTTEMPTQGGTYTRHPTTGALTRTEPASAAEETTTETPAETPTTDPIEPPTSEEH